MDNLVVHCKKAPYDTYIGRPGPWGNPFSHRPSKVPGTIYVASLAEALTSYEEWFSAQPELVERAKRELKGKVLGCWCKPGPCHGDFLAKIANS